MRVEDASGLTSLVFSPVIVAQALAELDGVSLLDTHWQNSQPRELLLSMCRNKEADYALQMWKKSLARMASTTRVPLAEIERQVRLHLPMVSFRALLKASGSRPPRKILEVVRQRCSKTKLVFEEHVNDSCVERIERGSNLVIEDGYIKILSAGRKISNAHISAVPRDRGLLIEKDLHYLQAPREDAIARYGMYLERAEAPVCYVSFARSDRAYVRLALGRALGRAVEHHEIMILARAFGIGQLPRNTISVLIAEACRRVKKPDCHFIVTAVNPFLGFDGCSMFASGFIPFAICPVAYNYSPNGNYVSRRQGGGTRTSAWLPPPNILFVRGVNRRARRELSELKLIYRVTDASHAESMMTTKRIGKSDLIENSQLSSVRHKLYAHLQHARRAMQDAWSDETCYHGTQHDPITPSKGQCGVTSFYLAHHLHKLKDLDVESALFCEGDVHFPNGTEPIKHHCWVKLRKAAGPDSDFIIDLTADQTGYEEPVIIDTSTNLQRRGIEYKPRSELPPGNVKVQHLRDRLDLLEKKLSSINANIF